MHCKSLWIKASTKCINVNIPVFVVSDDRKGVLSSLQSMPPFLQRQFNGEQLQYRSFAPLVKASWRSKHKGGVRETLCGIETALLPCRWWRHPFPLCMGVGVLDVRGWEQCIRPLWASCWRLKLRSSRTETCVSDGAWNWGVWEETEVLNEPLVEIFRPRNRWSSFTDFTGWGQSGMAWTFSWSICIPSALRM